MTGNRQQIVQWLLSQDDNKLFDIAEHKAKRSLDQNSFYWQVVGLIAKALRRSTAYVHNRILQDYGKPSELNGCLVEISLPDTEEAYKKAMESTTYHIKPTSMVEENAYGELNRTYVLMKGSHEMNKEEFSAILDGALEEARLLDVKIPEVQYGEYLAGK